MKKKDKKLLVVFLVFFLVIIINFIQSARLIKLQNFNFHTDIARDFFLIKDVVDSGRPTLLGGRVGEISGLFHGPAWLYLNLPVFIISQGNPVAQNYFCLSLVILSEIVFFIIAQKIFGFKSALIALLIYALKLSDWVGNYFHPFGAILFSPLFYYFFNLADQQKSAKKNFFILGFTTGLLAHFQLGFGLPMIIISCLKAFFNFIKKRISFGSLACLGLGLFASLANFIIFDFRHNFLQTRSAIDFLKKLGIEKINLLNFLQNRLKAVTYSGLGLPFSPWAVLLLLIFLITIFVLAKKGQHKKAYQNFILIFAGFWLISLINPGSLQGYHYWALLPLSILVLSSLSKFYPKLAFFIVIFYLALNIKPLTSNLSFLTQDKKTEAFSDYSSWRFISQVAQTVFEDSKGEFGYFAYTPDLYSYTPRYAMEYWNQFYSNRAQNFEKKPLTYLLLAPAPQDKPWLDGAWWVKNQVNIKKEPEKVVHFNNGFRIEKYLLSEKEIQVTADPNLIQSSHFR